MHPQPRPQAAFGPKDEQNVKSVNARKNVRQQTGIHCYPEVECTSYVHEFKSIVSIVA